MKSKFSYVLAIVLALCLVTPLTGCDGGAEDSEKSDVEIAIEKAQGMTQEELEEASKKELEENPDLIFNCDSLTSGVKKALPKFEEKYPWTKGRTEYNSKKGSEYQPKLIAAQEADSYIADFVLIQDASFLKHAMLDTNFLLSYVPQGEGYKIDKVDQNPLVGVTYNKVFMWDNTTVGAEELQNVWQLTGVDGKELKGLHNVSYQSPLGEDVNMNFLIMLTSPESCERLQKAYKLYFGSDYDPSKDEIEYENIGYKYVAEFINNVEYWHDSDSKEIKKINTYADDGRIIFAGLCKLKNYEYFKDEYEGTDQYYTKTVTAAGWNTQVEGFDGFVYNQWALIPKTAKLPYTSCLFINYLLSNEGFNVAWGGIEGYYSSNQLNPSAEGDKPLAEWKKQCVVEDVDYLDTAYSDVSKFVNMQMSDK